MSGTPNPPSSTPGHEPDPALGGDCQGVRFLRRFHEGSLQFHERRAEVKFIIESSTGHVVLPVEPGFATNGAEVLIWSPKEDDWDAQISMVVRPIDRPESVEAVDRWAGYHGSTSMTTWIRGEVDGIKTRDRVFSGDEALIPNALGRGEYALIKHANADRERLGSAAKRLLGLSVADPLCVGVDPWGMDVRARFGILRLEFPEGITARTPEAAKREIDRVLG